MTFKIFYYLFFSIVAVGCYHWIHEWFQESFSYYFSFSKVKTTDKLFELVEKSMEEKKETVGLEILEEKEEEKMGEEKVEVGKEEDLFHFIDGL